MKKRTPAFSFRNKHGTHFVIEANNLDALFKPGQPLAGKKKYRSHILKLKVGEKMKIAGGTMERLEKLPWQTKHLKNKLLR